MGPGSEWLRMGVGAHHSEKIITCLGGKMFYPGDGPCGFDNQDRLNRGIYCGGHWFGETRSGTSLPKRSGALRITMSRELNTVGLYIVSLPGVKDAGGCDLGGTLPGVLIKQLST